MSDSPVTKKILEVLVKSGNLDLILESVTNRVRENERQIAHLRRDIAKLQTDNENRMTESGVHEIFVRTVERQTWDWAKLAAKAVMPTLWTAAGALALWVAKLLWAGK